MHNLQGFQNYCCTVPTQCSILTQQFLTVSRALIINNSFICFLFCVVVSTYLVAYLLQDGTEIYCCGNSATCPNPCHHMLWPHHPLHQNYS